MADLIGFSPEALQPRVVGELPDLTLLKRSLPECNKLIQLQPAPLTEAQLSQEYADLCEKYKKVKTVDITPAALSAACQQGNQKEFDLHSCSVEP